MKKTLLVIVGHGAVDGTIRRHYPHWLASGCDVLVTSNSEDPSALAKVRVGRSAHSGEASIARMLEVFKTAYHYSHDFFVFGEYDTVTFRTVPEHPGNGVIYCPVHPNADPQFKARFYLHPILWMDRAALKRVLECADLLPLDAEGGFGDRWLGLLCEKNGIPFDDDMRTYSRNSIDREEFFQDAEHCLRSGGWAVHGVKTQECLERLLRSVKENR